MNTEDIVWKDEHLYQKVVSNKKKGGYETIRQRHYHVIEVDEKRAYHNLTYQLTSSNLTREINIMHLGLRGNYHIHCDKLLGGGCKAARKNPMLL